MKNLSRTDLETAARALIAYERTIGASPLIVAHGPARDALVAESIAATTALANVNDAILAMAEPVAAKCLCEFCGVKITGNPPGWYESGEESYPSCVQCATARVVIDGEDPVVVIHTDLDPDDMRNLIGLDPGDHVSIDLGAGGVIQCIRLKNK